MLRVGKKSRVTWTSGSFWIGVHYPARMIYAMLMLHPEQKRIYQTMTPEEKLRIALDLYHCAWDLKRAGLRAQHPDWSQNEIEEKVREIFLYART